MTLKEVEALAASKGWIVQRGRHFGRNAYQWDNAFRVLPLEVFHSYDDDLVDAYPQMIVAKGAKPNWARLADMLPR